LWTGDSIRAKYAAKIFQKKMLAEARREQAKLGIFPTAAPKASSKGWQAMPGAPALVRYLEVFFFFQKQPPIHFVLYDSFSVNESIDKVFNGNVRVYLILVLFQNLFAYTMYSGGINGVMVFFRSVLIWIMIIKYN